MRKFFTFDFRYFRGDLFGGLTAGVVAHFFGSTASFTETAKQIPTTASSLIIRLDKVPYIDQSGLYALETVILDLVQQHKKILLVGLKNNPNS